MNSLGNPWYTYKGTASKNAAEVVGKCCRENEDVDEGLRKLENRPATELLTPGRPQLATEGVEEQVDHLTCASLLLSDTEFFNKRRDRVWIYGSVVVHGDLNDRNRTQVHPFLPCWPVVGKDFVGIVFCQLALAVSAHFLVGLVGLVRRSDSLAVRLVVEVDVLVGLGRPENLLIVGHLRGLEQREDGCWRRGEHAWRYTMVIIDLTGSPTT